MRPATLRRYCVFSTLPDKRAKRQPPQPAWQHSLLSFYSYIWAPAAPFFIWKTTLLKLPIRPSNVVAFSCGRVGYASRTRAFVVMLAWAVHMLFAICRCWSFSVEELDRGLENLDWKQGCFVCPRLSRSRLQVFGSELCNPKSYNWVRGQLLEPNRNSVDRTQARMSPRRVNMVVVCGFRDKGCRRNCKRFNRF
ncbi:hypothetical protein B0T24DRAFT_640059 [Lasiosphaeria ovina]|uniref:Uncharacterized protein n=1 Tax=Lasiosphaeria ovina TaxID=92902 RepID=A0AAE0JTY1_9PEZI|nr:hypothetical protein B0T24DRAFT_640059 [Lasiosphaeria ovina]